MFFYGHRHTGDTRGHCAHITKSRTLPVRCKLPFKIGIPKVIPTPTGKTARLPQQAAALAGLQEWEESLLWQPRGYSCGPQTYLIFFSVSCSRAEWQSSISLTKSRFLFSAFSRSCLALSRSCTSCSTCPLPGDRWDTAVSLTDLPRLHCPTATSWSTLQLRPFY